MTGEGVVRATASSPRSQPNEDSSCQVIRVKESGVETPNNSSRARWLRGSFRADWPLDGLGGGAGNVGRGIAQGEEPPVVFSCPPLTQPAITRRGHDGSAGGATPTHDVGLH